MKRSFSSAVYWFHSETKFIEGAGLRICDCVNYGLNAKCRRQENAFRALFVALF